MTTVLLGYEVGSGRPVEIPLAHTFVSGQTQQSGKTTTLRAIVGRSGCRALAFVTKRGEDFEGRPIRPFVPRDGEQPIHWRQVEAILASALEQRNMKFERLWIINAAKGARSLDDVQANVRRLRAKAKGERSQETYTLLDEYLELVLPQMRELASSPTLDLAPGLNVMDLSGVAAQTQAMVIRAALERINHHETEVLTVLPEAWEFAPRGRSAPAKDEAIAMARKGAAPKVRNFLLVDSQDVAGVENVVRQACSVWLLGVQRELNEIKRAIALMPLGLERPKAKDVATLKLGEFYACWGAHVVKTYVQPEWMTVTEAQAASVGESTTESTRTRVGRQAAKERIVTEREAHELRDLNTTLTRANAELQTKVRDLTESVTRLSATPAETGHATPASLAVAGRHKSGANPPPTTPKPAFAPPGQGAAPAPVPIVVIGDAEATYQAVKARLLAEAATDPTLLRVLTTRPELEVAVARVTLEADGKSLRGRLGRLIAEGYFAEPRTQSAARYALRKTGPDMNAGSLSREFGWLRDEGFLRMTSASEYVVAEGAVVRVRATDA